MSESQGIGQRAAARDALTARIRVVTSAALAVAAALSGLFAGLAAASAPGHKLNSGTSAQRTPARKARRNAASAHSSKAIPPLPAAAGPGSDAAAPPPPTPAPAPAPTQSPPVVVSGGS